MPLLEPLVVADEQLRTKQSECRPTEFELHHLFTPQETRELSLGSYDSSNTLCAAAAHRPLGSSFAVSLVDKTSRLAQVSRRAETGDYSLLVSSGNRAGNVDRLVLRLETHASIYDVFAI